jgi:xanthine/CO dehydrogenase XdhC/CoxF family maturation factor
VIRKPAGKRTGTENDLSSINLCTVFDRWRATKDTMVLASVYATEGSTYSKAGAQMLISPDGDFQGMLSGGCLEGDLAERSRQVASGGRPQAVTYDLTQNDDMLWGLGVGCDGIMRIFLQRISASSGYQPFPAMRDVFEGRDRHVATTVIDSPLDDLPAGACLVAGPQGTTWTDVPEAYRGRLVDEGQKALALDASGLISLEFPAGAVTCLAAILRPYPRVLVLGAGLDAEPLVRMIAGLGWRATVSDHRPAYVESGDFELADDVRCMPAAEISAQLRLDDFDAAVVMSHHLASDETYLRQLAAADIPYVGLLGPRARRARLLDALGQDGAGLDGRLHGPAGLDINASGPASIALSIVAEMHERIVPPV